MRRAIPIVVTAVVGLAMILEQFVQISGLREFASDLRTCAVIIAGFALALAAVNLVLLHARRISMRAERLDESIVLLASMTAMLVAGLVGGKTSPSFRFLFNSIMMPASATIFAMMTFWIVSASYRVFRGKSARAIVLMLSAGLVMLGRAPVSEAMWSKLPAIADWIMGSPTVAGQRAVDLCSALGILSMGLRVMLGLERGHAGGGE